MDVMERRQAIIAAQDRFIPPEYQKYDYLETIGTASNLNTGVAGNDNTIQIDFGVKPLAKGNYVAIMGNSAGENYCGWRFIQSTTANVKLFHMSLNNRRLGSSSSVTINNVDTVVGNYFDVHMEYRTGYVISKGTKYECNPVDDGYAVSTNNIDIGNSAPGNGGANSASNRFYYFRIKKQGMLIRNYIPVVRKSDNKVGFYDTVNHTFNPSTGPAEFAAAGND